MESKHEFRVWVLAMVLSAGLLFGIGSCIYQESVVMPIKMAEQGMCKTTIVGHDFTVYRPCVITEGK